MVLFFDTSALVKFFHREEGTDVAVSIIAEPNNEIWVCNKHGFGSNPPGR